MVLGDSAGLGKTLQSISGYAFHLQKDPSLKLLIITPKSAAYQWKEEFEKFSKDISVHILTNKYGKIKDKKEEYGYVEDLKKNRIKHKTLRGFDARKAQYDTVKDDVFISTYYTVQEDYEFLIQNRLPNYMVVYDECQAFKGEKTKTFFGANEIAQKASKVYGLSATIIKNRLEEAYNIYRVIVPGLFGSKQKFYNNFTIRKKMKIWRKGRNRYFNKIVGYQNLSKFQETIDPYFLIRRTREVASELPRLISKKIKIQMTDAQVRFYKEALSGDLYKKIIRDKYFRIKEYIDSNPNAKDSDYEKYEILQQKYDESLTSDGMRKNKIAALAYCQLVANGPAWINEEGKSSKVEEFHRLFDQELSTEKVIVFTRFKSGIKHLEKVLDKLELKHARITGDETDEQRTKARQSFQDPKSNVSVIFITYAGSAALNLQSANVIVFYDTPWSYGDLYQTIGRAQRIGSLYEHIYLIHLVCEKTIDEHVIQILESKKSLINDIMGDIAEGAIDFKEDRKMFKEEEGEVDALYSSVFG